MTVATDFSLRASSLLFQAREGLAFRSKCFRRWHIHKDNSSSKLLATIILPLSRRGRRRPQSPVLPADDRRASVPDQAPERRTGCRRWRDGCWHKHRPPRQSPTSSERWPRLLARQQIWTHGCAGRGADRLKRPALRSRFMGRKETTSEASVPSRRAARYASQRSDTSSPQCASSTASRIGLRVARLTTSQ